VYVGADVGAGEVDGIDWVDPRFAGGTGRACCSPDETHADNATDINRTDSRRIEFLQGR
jgi:hypothetical protein